MIAETFESLEPPRPPCAGCAHLVTRPDRQAQAESICPGFRLVCARRLSVKRAEASGVCAGFTPATDPEQP